MKLEINTERKQENNEHMATKQHATKKQWVNNEIKEEIRKYLETNENENRVSQNL